jgi:hypothetical protein
VLARADRALRDGPAERRPARAAAVGRLRAAAAGPAAAGTERALEALRGVVDDDAWLAAAGDVLAPTAPVARGGPGGGGYGVPAPGAPAFSGSFRLAALVLLLP